MQPTVTPQGKAANFGPAKREGLGLTTWLLWITVAFAVRLYPAITQISQDEPMPLPDGEGLFHIRRIREILRRFPEVQTFDPYMSFPEGSLIPGEPGLDLLLGYVIRFGTGFVGGELSTLPATESILWVALLAIPIIGVLSLPIYGLIARELGPRGALSYLLPILALTGATVTPGTIGHISSDVLEPLLFALPILPLLIASREGPNATGTSNTISLSAAGGLLLGGSFFFWRGMTLSATVIAIWLGGRALSKRKAGALVGFELWGGSLAMGVAAAVAAPLCISHPMGRAGQVTAETLSWLQPLYLFSLGAGLGLMTLSLRYMGGIMEATAISPAPIPALGDGLGGSLRRGLGSLLAITIGLTPLALLCFVSPSMRTALPEAPFPWLAHAPAAPLQGVHGWGLFEAPAGSWVLLNPLAAFGATLVLWPLALLRLRKNELKAPLLLISMALLLGIAGLMDQRYIPLLGPTYALVIALGLHPGDPRPGMSLWRGLIALILFAPALPGITQPWGRPETPSGLVDALKWLAQETPQTSGFALGEGQGSPSYGILAPPDLGHHVIEVGKRPAVCIPGEASALRHPCRGALEALFSGGIEAAMDAPRARYLLLGQSLRSLSSPRLLSQDPNGPAPAPHGAAALFLNDGRLESTESPLQGLRLIYEGVEQGGQQFKIFERVEGARIVGRWRPNHRIEFRIPIITNQGRSFMWSAMVRVDPQGRFEIRVPYANLARPEGWTWAQAPGELTAFGPGGEEIRRPVAIDPESVRLGWTIRSEIKAP